MFHSNKACDSFPALRAAHRYPCFVPLWYSTSFPKMNIALCYLENYCKDSDYSLTLYRFPPYFSEFLIFLSFPAVISDNLCNFALAFCNECKTYCSIAFEITTSNKESKPNMERAEPIWRRLFRIMFGFVVNLKGVWQRPAPFLLELCVG